MNEIKKERLQDKDRYSMKGSRLWGLLLFLILFLIDMLTKLVADAYFSATDTPSRLVIVEGWLSLCITYNDGIAYGMGDTAPTWAKILVIAITAVMMLAIAILYCKVDRRRSWLRTALIFVLAGGVGNLVDRVYYRVWERNCLYGVRDMVDLSRFGFAVCNFADFFICAGAAMLVVAFLFFDKDAICPVGKYKALAQESTESQETEAKTAEPVEKEEE